jgi:NADP-dependent aldehyde dehydrogenase
MRAINPESGVNIEPPFGYVGAAEIEDAVAAARAAFGPYRATTPEARAVFMERAADLLDEHVDALVDRARQETGLTEPRLRGEVARTSGQLRLFATELRSGLSAGARIDPAQPDRQPAPRLDIRQRLIPLGPVVVFGASNFPFAFSTLGGDTASALAAGCPVIVKAHNSHPGTAELVAQLAVRAARETGMPAGVFSLVFGRGADVGQQLAAHPGVTAIAFTGSRAGGTALMATAAARPVPIPVYAEMSSINPVIFGPAAIGGDTATLARELVGSLTLGSGQFCTNPGLIFVPSGHPEFVEQISAAVREQAGQTMLSPSIRRAFDHGVSHLVSVGAHEKARGTAGEGANAPAPALLGTTASTFSGDDAFQHEVFGAAGLVVEYDDVDDLERALGALDGQLTATLRIGEADTPLARRLLPTLELIAGRILVNGWPTGVEVGHAMVHGGPFPATSDSRTTSVGSLAIARFLRPVAYQNIPDALLPPELQQDNPWSLPRRIDGQMVVSSVGA